MCNWYLWYDAGIPCVPKERGVSYSFRVESQLSGLMRGRSRVNDQK